MYACICALGQEEEAAHDFEDLLGVEVAEPHTHTNQVRVFTCTVGRQPSSAAFCLLNAEEVLDICMHVCLHACMLACMHACVCVCVFACLRVPVFCLLNAGKVLELMGGLFLLTKSADTCMHTYMHA